MKTFLNIYNITIEYDEKGRKHPNFFKDMEELYAILRKY